MLIVENAARHLHKVKTAARSARDRFLARRGPSAELQIGRCIELFGAPGAGKTTLYRAVMALPESDLCLQSWEVSCGGREPPKLDLPPALRGDQRVQAFVEFYLEAIVSGTANPITRLKRAAAMSRDIQRVVTTAMAPSPPFILLDEGLCVRGISLALTSGARRHVERYFNLLPLPAAIVALTPASAFVSANLADRSARQGRKTQHHRSSAEMAVSAGLDILRRRGARILELESTDLAQNAKRVVDFARNLAISRP